MNIQPFEMNESLVYFAYRRTSRETNDDHEIFHSHQGIEFLFIHQGTGTLVIDHKTYDIKPGMLIVYQPYQLHHLQVATSADAPFVRSILLFEPSLYETYFRPWPELHAFLGRLVGSKLPFPCLYDAAEHAGLAGFWEDVNSWLPVVDKKDQLEQISLAIVVFIRSLKQIWLQHETRPLPAVPRKTHQAEAVLDWIRRHLDEPFRLEHVARELHLSTFHLSHLFKEAIGVSISDYMAAQRIHKAVQLLTTTQLPLPQIGERIGITNSSYFCQFFKAHMGITPHQYRKKWFRPSVDPS
ncbi:MAG: helix-turn-helix transcriptional regulator [Paenibacillaceae bacterium]|nr:helix-turn-helix transcriptional regulator [Paenibacillaceae bacterium]